MHDSNEYMMLAEALRRRGATVPYSMNAGEGMSPGRAIIPRSPEQLDLVDRLRERPPVQTGRSFTVQPDAMPAQGMPEDEDTRLIREAMGLFTEQQMSPILADQIAQAQALQQTGDVQILPGSPIGTALLGAGKVIDAGVGAYRERGLRDQQKESTKRQQEMLLAVALRGGKGGM